MKAKSVILGCGGFILLLLVLILGGVVVLGYLAKDVEGVAATVNGPAEVMVGEIFDLEVIVKNDRPHKVLRLSDIDIADEYLAGFTISSVKPKPKSDMHVPIDNSRSYTFDLPISPGASNTFVFTLRAQNTGIYRGDVDICEGARFISVMAQTVVKAKE